MANSYQDSSFWFANIYQVEWFKGTPAVDAEKASVKLDSDGGDPDCLKDQAQSVQDDEVGRAPWAPKIRRGVDAPFKTLERLPSSAHTSSTLVFSQTTFDMSGNRSTERVQESCTSAREYPLNQLELSSLRIDKHDLPIPLPRRSEWVRADEVKGLDVQNTPSTNWI